MQIIILTRWRPEANAAQSLLHASETGTAGVTNVSPINESPTFVAQGVVVLLEHGAQVGQRLAALVQQRQHALADAHVAHQPQVADDQRALQQPGVASGCG